MSNINACVAVVDAVRTTLGPRGMDKLVYDERVRRKATRRQASLNKQPTNQPTNKRTRKTNTNTRTLEREREREREVNETEDHAMP